MVNFNLYSTQSFALQMKFVRIIIILLMSFSVSFGELPFIPSNAEGFLLTHHQKDTIRVNYLQHLSFYYRSNDPPKALELADEALQISRKINYGFGIVYSLNHLGTIYNSKGQIQKSLNYYLEAERMAPSKDLNVQKGIALAINNIGIIYEQRGNYELAKDYLSRALAIDNSIKYTKGIAREYGNLGKLMLDVDDPDSSLYFLYRSLALDSSIDNRISMVETYTDIGRTFSLKKNYSSALAAFEKSFALIEDDDISGAAYNHQSLAVTFRQMGENDSALFHQQRAFNLATMLDSKVLIRDASFELAILYRLKSDYKSALFYIDKYNFLNSFLSDQKAASLLADMREKYESEKKQEQIVGLEKIKERMEFFNSNLLKFRNGLFFLLTICILLAATIYKAYRDKRRVNRELMRKFGEVRQMNDEIKLKSMEIEAKNKAILVTNNILKSQRHQLIEAQRISKLGSWEYDPIKRECSWSEQLFDVFEFYPAATPPSLKSFFNKIHPDDREGVFTSVKKVYREYQSITINFRILGHYDEIKFIQAKAVPEFNRNQEIILISGTVLDATDQKLNERKLVEAKDQAEFANHSKSLFLANMSHEIRTPLNGILGFTDILLHENSNTEQKEYLRYIRNSGDTLLLLLNDILDFNKIEHGKLHIEEVNFQLRELTNQAILPYQIQAKEKGVSLNVDISHEIPVWIVGDPHRTRQLLINFVSNAVKFTNTGSINVTVHIKNISIPSGDQLLLYFNIADSGVGVEKAKQDLIFDLFTQADNSTTRKFGGTGLGLAITRQLSKLMGGTSGVISPGTLQLESGNPGSDFWFTISVKRGITPASYSIVQETKAQFRFDENFDVLVAEDNPINQMLIRKVLETMNCKVTIVENGQLAFDELVKNKFDIVLLDIQMPVLDGYQTAIKIRQSEYAMIPIVGVSANVFKEDIQKSLDAGMDAHIGKPFKTQELFEVIHRFLNIDSRKYSRANSIL